ncbi:MAG: hypothetical protein ACKOBO_03010 [Acidimicrobiales bacterium]
MRAPRRVLPLVGTAALTLVLCACSPGASDDLCRGRVSVADWVLQLTQGLANFDDSAATQLEADSLSVLDVVIAARDADRGGPDASALSEEVADFVAAMNSLDWSVSAALDDARAVAAADALGTEETLRKANVVEAAVLTECGTVPTIVQPADTAETLPFPSVPSPTATDPDSGPPDEESEARALGTEVGNAFGLTLTDEQVVCLGRSLNGVTDATGALAGPGQYQAQFQAAFDGCGIGFEVPS